MIINTIPVLNLPEDYFDNFEDRMILKVMEEDLPKKHGFKVPRSYFGEFDERMMSKVVNEKPKVISIFRNKTLHYVSGIAASIVLIFSLVNGFNTDPAIEDLSASSVEEYIYEGGIQIDSYDVLALLEEEDINELTIPSEEISEESLENYLIENIDDTSLLIE